MVVNSTIGIGGLIDLGTAMGLERQQEDFGQTLAVWGVPSGPYLVVPFRGPITLRDGVGIFVDSYFNPVRSNGLEFEKSAVRDKLLVLSILEQRRQVLDFDQQIYDAPDPYAYWRATYWQRRLKSINDSNTVESKRPVQRNPDQ